MSKITITVRKVGYERSLIIPDSMVSLQIEDEGEGWVKLSISDKQFWNQYLRVDQEVDFDFKYNDEDGNQVCISVLYSRYQGDGVFLKRGTKVSERLYYDSSAHDKLQKIF